MAGEATPVRDAVATGLMQRRRGSAPVRCRLLEKLGRLRVRTLGRPLTAATCDTISRRPILGDGAA